MMGLSDGHPPAGDQEPAANLFAWWMAILMAAYYALSTIDRTILVHLVDPIRNDLRLSDFEMSIILGPAFGFCLAFFALPFGWAVDRYPRRWILLFGVFSWSLATMLSGLANSFLQLTLARMAVAVGEAALMPAALSLLADRFPRRRLTTGIAVFNMGTKAGQSLAFVFAGLALAMAAGVAGSGSIFGGMKSWQLVLMMVGAPGALMAFLIFTVREPPRRLALKTVEEDAGSSFIAFLKERRAVFIPLFLGFCAVSIAGNALLAWVPTHLGRAYGWTAVQYGPWLGAASAIGSLSLLAKGAIIDWLYARGMRDAALRFYTWLLMALTPLGVLAFMAPTPLMFVLGFSLLNIVALPFILYALTTIQLITPSRYRGKAVGLFQFLIPVFSQGLGPTVTAALTDFVFRDPAKLGWSLTIVTTVSMTTALVLLRYSLRTMRRSLAGTAEPRATDM